MNTTNELNKFKEYSKQKLYDDLSKIVLKYPFNKKIEFIENYFNKNYHIDKISNEKLKKYINNLYNRYKGYEFLNYFKKIKLLKNEYIRFDFIDGKFKLENKEINVLALDFALVKEIQLEKEGNKNKFKPKKPLSANPSKNSKKQFFVPPVMGNLLNKNNNNNFNINKIINNYQPVFHFDDKSEQIIEKFNEEILIWIDKNYDNFENNLYLKKLKKNKNLSIFCFKNVKEALNFILSKNEIKFRAIFILISGSLYPDYYKKLKEKIKKITFLPTRCIFTSDSTSNKIKENKELYKELEIESSFYNKEGVKTQFFDCIKSFEKYILYNNSKLKNFNHSKFNKSYDGCLTFEQIYSENQLFLPFIFNNKKDNIINSASNKDIISFENFIQGNFKEEQIQKLIIPMLYIKNFPKEILSKFFARMYTEETKFYREMNKALMKQEKNYNTYVKVMYEGLYLGSLYHSENDILYRGTKMTRKEIDNIRKSFEEWNKIKDKNLPKFLLYSRTFLSFTKDKINIRSFLGKTDEYFYRVIFILKNNTEILNKYSSNADLENLSSIPSEKEVLFFPYTAFCLKNIFEKIEENQKCIYIELDYLGVYEHIFNKFISSENIQNEFFNSLCIKGINYNSDIISSDLLNNIDNNNNKNDYAEKLIMKIKNIKNELITVKFIGNSFPNFYEIQCSPNITGDELIYYFLEKYFKELLFDLTINEIKQKVVFLCNGETSRAFGPKKIEDILSIKEEKRITILIIDQDIIIKND